MTKTITSQFINFLERTQTGRPLTAVEQQLVAETWAMAQVPPKRGALTITEIATVHAQFTDPLLARVLLTRDVISNTLKKLGGEVPPELKWAENVGWSVSVGALHRSLGYQQLPSDITADVMSGRLTVEETDVLRVTVGRLQTVSIPLTSLSSNSSTVIAQRTRAAHAAHALAVAADSHRKAKQTRNELAARIRQLQTEVDELDELIVEGSRA